MSSWFQEDSFLDRLMQGINTLSAHNLDGNDIMVIGVH